MLNNSCSSSGSSYSSQQYHAVNRRMCASVDPGNAVRLSTVVTDRGLSESLLEMNEEFQELDCNFSQNVPFEMADAISAWQDVAPNAKVVIQRKKRMPAHSADDAQVRARNRIEEYSKLNKKTVESLFTTAALWRMCVEQTTYRYIPNNGRYRSSKSDNKLDRDGKLARTIRSMDKLSPDQRNLQKEIQRELRAEFEIQQKLEKQAERNRQKALESRKPDSHGHSKSDRLDYSKKPPKDPLFHRRIRTPVELPPINVPLMGKSVNENYMDTFHLRLNNLEEEMKRDQVLLKKKQQEYVEDNITLANAQVFRSRSELVASTKTSHYMDFSGLPLFTEPVTEECLSVRPIANRSGKSSARDDVDSDNIPPSCSTHNNNLDDEAMRTVFIKYTTSNGDVVRIPKFAPNVNMTKAAAVVAAAATVETNAIPSTTDQNVVLRRTNGTLTQGKGSLRTGTTKEQALHAREFLVSTQSAPPSSVASTFKYTRSNHRKLTTNGAYNKDDPPIIVAEGLFSRSKGGGHTENIQVTVKARKRDKSQNSMAQNFIPGVAGKNCEVSQRT